LFVVQVGNGFTTGGGVVIAEQHVLTHRSIVRGASRGFIQDSQGRRLEARVLSEDPELDVALLQVAELSDAAEVGLSGELLKGDTVMTQVFDGGGSPVASTGRVVGWKYERGRAFMETNLDTPSEAKGAGIFGPYGKLVGVQAFKLGSERTFVLPIEYITNGPGAVTASILGVREDDPAFTATRASAAKHLESIVVALDYDELKARRSASRTALVGSLTMLDSKSEPSRNGVSYRLEAADAAGAQRVLAEGDITPAHRRWAAQPEAFADISAQMVETFGDIWVEDNLAQNDYGELRYRIPVEPICGNVTEGDAHALTVTLSDGRSTGHQVFFDMAAVCGGGAAGEGEAWEADWFSGPAPAAPVAAAEDGMTKAKMKMKSKRKGKRKRRGKRKSRRRRRR
jgi:hypothetical protein